ncbi:MAG: helix-turn-helix transcriptional regulator [Candidatus Hydrogenedentes bacterium]|nr:helix-turn-helix transcriptional regulator [Candidatus Hydrogenedentota bacterium]
MKIKNALDALSSLAQETRLRIYRTLVRTGPDGLTAGEIADALGVPAPTLSFHLAHLARAGMVRCRRDGRSLIYSVHVEGMRALLQFLTEDCCRGKPELCGRLVANAACGATPPKRPRRKKAANE